MNGCPAQFVLGVIDNRTHIVRFEIRLGSRRSGWADKIHPSAGERASFQVNPLISTLFLQREGEGKRVDWGFDKAY